MSEENWHEKSLSWQLGNIGSEVSRAINRDKIGDSNGRQNALERALELIDFTLSDKKHINRLKEIVRLRELLAGHYINNNYYQVGLEDLNKYLLSFALLAKNK
ncbi:MAG: hypothetical protein A3B89_02805 [Candidatus Buchananbacteria bacterium RIFCSPHIGHO2_02_FULL_40_13]|uniref:Four helix bundle protein n=1 Tax=Candidatus Buchananbacteria bacterium RIFCSPLOWO2_01_FULL_39_33 TaxID=1797543 RepID=A0A1G1YJD0_9BACT|nr:MAG: hypothetical protein A2820_02185 [Candidatus Buchananbacteria bacterium RIFCSPHIGHO2_01_FULL_40_35]OGY49933.1 MAG: hypothetical protein A3B89_02805 [Candidatus Buchananbacteria bacterium RIFCSPHIGHO2_02_FULL_40_13]OGY51926.1 MAG: hypothetical protein A3A02_01275 [Candidatus Buchananbacteria bacterium RIFCSPLOWO2_01_FULL_39_33]